MLFGSMKVNSGGILEVGGVSTTNLVAEYGSPLYVMDQQYIEDRIEEIKTNFKSDKFNTEIIYASKAFLNKAMCQLVNKTGISMDVVSEGELYTAIAANFPLEKTYFHGNNKTLGELELALISNVGTIVIDNIYEFKKIEYLGEKLNKSIDVLLRVNPGIDAHTHEYIQTSKFSSKFGESIYDDSKIGNFVTMLDESPYTNFRGFHCHIGSQIFDKEPFMKAIEVMVEFVKKVKVDYGVSVDTLNIGGGFGIYYTKGDKPIDLPTTLQEMIKSLEEVLESQDVNIKNVMIEPGRSVVANAGLTLYSIGGVKETYSGKKYYFIDGGMTDNIRTALYQADYEGTVANRMFDPSDELVTIAGKCCESGDTIINDKRFQRAVVGDILAVFSTGAYNYSMSSNYNRITKPAVVMVKNGKSKLIVKRETLEDLIRNDLNLED